MWRDGALPRPARAKSSGALGRLAHRLGNIRNDLLQQALVVALPHHPDDTLGAGGTNDEASLRAKALLARGDGLHHLGMLQRRAVGVLDVLEAVRQSLVARAHRADARASGDTKCR